MIHTRIFVWLVLFFSILIPYHTQSSPTEEFPPKHQKWLEEEVVYIITPLEKDIFLQLESDRERAIFIEAFWNHRDPTATTAENEFKDNHYDRIRYADHNFGRSAPKQGWQTDRGRIYILLGKPNDIEKFFSEPGIYNTEVWFYQGMAEYGLPSDFYLIFFQRDGIGEYVLYKPSSDGPQSLLVGYMGNQTDFLSAYRSLKKNKSPSCSDIPLSNSWRADPARPSVFSLRYFDTEHPLCTRTSVR